MQRHHQKSSEQDRDMHHHDAPVWLAHQLLQTDALVFALADIIGYERHAVADRQAEDRPAQTILRSHIPKRGGIRKSAGVASAIAKHGHDKNAMDEREHAVVKTEKWDEK